MRSIVIALLAALLATAAGAQEHLRLATTTSTENTGLLAAILPRFEQRFALRVDVVAVGSGQALKLAENGDADVVLSHAPKLEDAFVDAGHGVNRRGVMYNDFIIVGPPADPAGVRGTNAAAALKAIAAAHAAFLSRGDESGTHQKEKELWQAAGLAPSGDWYRSAGVGMGQLLQMADEQRAYTLSDRGTYLAQKQKGELLVLVEGDAALFNPYTVIATNPAKHPTAKYIEAMELIAWLTSPEGQQAIGGYRIAGQVLFHPTAVPEASR
jgi:tungstate transport system substrate-binding protein